MNWKTKIQRWRQLSPEQQRQIRRRNLPRKVARSMAFEGEPVSEQMLQEELDRLVHDDVVNHNARKQSGI